MPAAPGENLFAGGRGIAADVVVVHEAGGRGQDERHRVRAFDAHAGIFGLRFSAIGKHHSTAWKRIPSPSTGAISRLFPGIGPFQHPSMTSLPGFAFTPRR